MRYKVSNSECVHLWAHQAQGHAEGSSISFVNDEIYSYGRHFIMGKFVKGTRKRQAVLITTDTYSSTTAHHVSMTTRAVDHLTVFHVPIRRDRTNEKYLADYAERIYAQVEKAKKARQNGNRPYYFQSAKNLTEEANRFAEFFGLRKRLSLPEDINEAVGAAAHQSNAFRQKELKAWAKRQAEIKAREEAENWKRIEEATAAIPEWQRGERNAIPCAHLLPSAYLRFIHEGKDIQTSEGAIFPAEHGQKAYRLLKRLQTSGQSYRANGHTIHLGHYSLDSFDAQTGKLRAGCHTLTWEVIAQFATLAGWDHDDENTPINGHPTEDNRTDERSGFDAIGVSRSAEESYPDQNHT